MLSLTDRIDLLPEKKSATVAGAVAKRIKKTKLATKNRRLSMEWKTNYNGMSVITLTRENDGDTTKTFRDEGTGELLAHYKKTGGELLITAKGSARLADISFYLEHCCGLMVVKINKT